MNEIDRLARDLAAERGWHWFTLGDEGYLGRNWWRNLVMDNGVHP